MRLLYSLLFTIVMITIASADEKKVHIKLPLTKSLPILKNIEMDAIRLGNGPVRVHIFVDPLCPHSRDFVEMIAESEKMRKKYSYYFYLYTLKRFHSEPIVYAIYTAPDQKEAMLNVMIRDQNIEPINKPSSKIQKTVHAIDIAAKKIDVYKRPYMIMVKKPKLKRGH